MTPETIDALTIWKHYHRGHLPEPGGLLDQPAALIEALLTLEEEDQKWRDRLRAQQLKSL